MKSTIENVEDRLREMIDGGYGVFFPIIALANLLESRDSQVASDLRAAHDTFLVRAVEQMGGKRPELPVAIKYKR